MSYDEALSDFTRSDVTHGAWTRPVYRKGAGPAVIVIHEMPGLHPMVLDFARRVAEAGMTVFCPSLFGEPGKPASVGYALGEIVKAICVRREFNVWAAGRSSPIVDWLRALAREAHAECGGKGVGAVGMCFTGGFALAMMTETAVTAPVLSQPSLPFAGGKAGALDASDAEIACARRRFETEGLTMIGLRFTGDPSVPDGRFDRLSREFGEAFERWDIDPSEAAPSPLPHPHSVLTLNLKDTGRTREAERRVIDFFRERTGA